MARILVVDDDRSVRAAITKILSKNGHEVVEAAGRKSALALYRAASADLVMMDVYMPEMDGIDTTVRLKQEFPKPLRQKELVAIVRQALAS